MNPWTEQVVLQHEVYQAFLADRRVKMSEPTRYLKLPGLPNEEACAILRARGCTITPHLIVFPPETAMTRDFTTSVEHLTITLPDGYVLKADGLPERDGAYVLLYSQTTE